MSDWRESHFVCNLFDDNIQLFVIVFMNNYNICIIHDVNSHDVYIMFFLETNALKKN